MVGNEVLHVSVCLINSSGTEDNLSDQEKSDTESERERADRIAHDINKQREVTPGRKKILLHRRHSYGAWSRSLKKVDKVYTIGCFDLFHDGHVNLFQRLRTLGKQVIIYGRYLIFTSTCILPFALSSTGPGTALKFYHFR